MIRYFTLLLFIGLAWGQSRKNINDLIFQDGLLYNPTSFIPYTGTVYRNSNNSKRKLTEAKYLDGLLNGFYREWYPNGEKKIIGKYQIGLMNGNWSFYSTDGQLKFKCQYKNGSGNELISGLQVPKDGIDNRYNIYVISDYQKEFETFLIENNWNGYIIFLHTNNQKYGSGQYIGGEKNGRWSWWYENGRNKEILYWKDGKRIGVNKKWYDNGILSSKIYYDDDKKSGYASGWHYDKGKKYEGIYREDLMDGRWVYWNENNQIQNEENYEYGLKSGVSITFYNNGQKKEESTWLNGEMHGLWNHWAQNGELLFYCNYKNFKKHGMGRIKDSETSSIYEGEWSNDNKHGNGRLSYLDGSVFVGEWKNDVKDGYGVLTNSKGKSENQQWINGKLIRTISDGTLETKEKLTTYYHSPGNKSSEGLMLNNKKIGKWSYWNEWGQLEKEEHYKEGLLHGLLSSWWTGTQLKEKDENYQNGKKNGTFIRWHSNGKKALEGYWVNDKPNGRWKSWYPNGQIKEEWVEENGVLNGVRTYYYENGQQKIEENYKNGFLNGVKSVWHENGRKYYDEKYINGKMISQKMEKDKDSNSSLIENSVNRDFMNIETINMATTISDGCKELKVRYLVLLESLINLYNVRYEDGMVVDFDDETAKIFIDKMWERTFVITKTPKVYEIKNLLIINRIHSKVIKMELNPTENYNEEIKKVFIQYKTEINKLTEVMSEVSFYLNKMNIITPTPFKYY